MKKIFITTSWDDGHKLDMKLVELLRKYKIAGTFYISPENREIEPKDRLVKGDIKDISKDFEIGAHTMTHPILTKINDKLAEKEIIESKKYLENIIGKEVTSFCYPAGYYKEKHKEMARRAGFTLARTVERFSLSKSTDVFSLPTTVHAYRHWSDIFPIFRHAGPGHFFKQYFNWDELAISLFDEVLSSGGVFHLWGHSCEIEERRDWWRLERVLAHISGHLEVNYVCNNELV